MKKIFIILIAFSTLTACTSQTKEKNNTQKQAVKNTYQKLNVAQFKKGITNKDIQLIDVRTPQEYQQGHIEGAKMINYMAGDFKTKIQALDKSKPVYLYCRSGGRSGRASKVLKDLGFEQINDLSGGYMAWERQSN